LRIHISSTQTFTVNASQIKYPETIILNEWREVNLIFNLAAFPPTQSLETEIECYKYEFKAGEIIFSFLFLVLILRQRKEKKYLKSEASALNVHP
jgi:hypothetical protein